MLARPPKADPLAPSARYRAAYRRWGKFARRRAELLERIEGIKLALALTRNPGDADRVPEHLQKGAAPYLQVAEDQPGKLLKELAATVRDRDELRAKKLPAERDAWQAALREETNRIARLLQPAHRAAVTDLASAVEGLSRAIHAERAVHDELSRRAPLTQSAYLPRLGRELGTGALSDVGSPLWRWRRRLHELQIL